MAKNKVEKISDSVIKFDGVRYIKEDSTGWLDIPELKISAEIEVHDKNKSWDDLGLKDREEELLTSEECRIIMNNPKYAKILKMDGSSSEDDFFIKQPYDLNRKNDYIAWFYAGSDYAYLDCYEDSDYSYSDLGVRFVRRTKVGK